MQNIPDNELDKIFKEAAGKFKAEFDPKAWEAMEKKLDDLPPEGGGLFYYRFLAGFIVLLLLIGGFVGWYAEQHALPVLERIEKMDGATMGFQQKIEKSEAVDSTIDQSSEKAGAQAELKAKKADDGSSTGGSPGEISTSEKAIAEEREHKQGPTTGEFISGQQPDQRLMTSSQDEIQSTSGSWVVMQVVDGSHQQSVPADTNAVIAEENVRDAAKQNGFGYLVWSPQLPGGKMHPVVLDEPSPVDPVASQDAAGEEVKDEKKVSEQGPWAISVMFAPDFSSVGYFEPDRSGSNFGASIEYFLSKRLSVTAGAIYSTKIYFTDEPVEGYFTGRYNATVERLDADCKVLDIPIDLTYYLSQRNTNNFYISAGFSSYFMLSEFYKYQGEWNGQQWEAQELFENKNNHFFGLFNFSIGYERRLSQKLFLQVEPFLKSPIQGIGEGGVDLVSSGMFINLKYRFSKRINP